MQLNDYEAKHNNFLRKNGAEYCLFLKKDDTFLCGIIIEGQPLYLDMLEQGDKPPTAYICGKRGGVRFEFLALSLVCALIAFMLFGGNRFSFLNLTVWILSLVFAVLAYGTTRLSDAAAKIRDRIRHLFSSHFSLKFSLNT